MAGKTEEFMYDERDIKRRVVSKTLIKGSYWKVEKANGKEVKTRHEYSYVAVKLDYTREG